VRRAELLARVTESGLTTAKEVVVAALRNPAVTMIGGVAMVEYLERRKLITGVEALAINTTLISKELVTTVGAAAPIIAGLLK
jgi:phosphatidylglycerophosphate synthase